MCNRYIVKRTQIYLTGEQGRMLARRSEATGSTVSALIRAAIDERVRIARKTAGAWKDFPETGVEYVERLRGSRRLSKLHRAE